MLDRLAKLQNQEERLEREKLQLASEIQSIESLLAQKSVPTPLPSTPTNNNQHRIQGASGKVEHTKLKITINWSTIGKNLKNEIIDEGAASRTMAKFLSQLIAAGGRTEEEILRHSKMPGSQLNISETPLSDPAFINKIKHVPYNNSPIPGTKLFIQTGTNTIVKKSALEKLIHALGFPKNFVVIEVVGKSEWNMSREELDKLFEG